MDFLEDRDLGEEYYKYVGTGITNLMVIASRNYYHLLTCKYGKEIDTDIVNMVNNSGNTALHFALDSTGKNDDMYQMIKYLIYNGANLTIPNKSGITALSILEKLAKSNENYAWLLFLINITTYQDILNNILFYLTIDELFEICDISKYLNHKLCEDEDSFIWKFLVMKDGDKDFERRYGYYKWTSKRSYKQILLDKIYDILPHEYEDEYETITDSNQLKEINERFDTVMALLRKYKSFLIIDGDTRMNILRFFRNYNRIDLYFEFLKLYKINYNFAMTDYLEEIGSKLTPKDEHIINKLIELGATDYDLQLEEIIDMKEPNDNAVLFLLKSGAKKFKKIVSYIGIISTYDLERAITYVEELLKNSEPYEKLHFIRLLLSESTYSTKLLYYFIDKKYVTLKQIKDEIEYITHGLKSNLEKFNKLNTALSYTYK